MDEEGYFEISKQIGLSYIIKGIYFLLGPLFLIVLTRNLTIIDFGIYSLLVVGINVASTLFEVGISQYFITKLPGENLETKTKTFYSLFFFEILFLIILFCLMSLPFIRDFILVILGIPNKIALYYLSLIIIVSMCLFRLVSAYFTANKKVALSGFFAFSEKSLWMIMLIVFFMFVGKINLLVVFSIWGLGVLVNLIISFLISKKDLLGFRIKQIQKNIIKKGLKFGLPLILFLVGTWVMAIGDRYIINWLMGVKKVGIYSLTYTLLGVVFSLGALISSIFYPYIVEAWKKKKHQILLNAEIKYVLLIVVPASIGFFAMKEALITLISGVKYLESAALVGSLILYPLLTALIFIIYQLLLLKEKTKFIGYNYLVGGVINIILNLILIPYIGLIGAGIATTLSYLMIFIVMYMNVRKEFNLNYRFIKPFRIVLASFIMGFIVLLMNPLALWYKILTILIGVLIYIGLLFVFRVFVKEEIFLLKKIRSKFRVKKIMS
ncbi:lipopolysaccharide biosynthesis protein [Candidatus Woesearchaeota archaeon]|nr:lipopolysaccharide biosynthesis protein [Candidatus Woesearchaeota archaeon]